MRWTHSVGVAAALLVGSVARPAPAQQPADGVNGKHACALIGPAQIKEATGKTYVTPGRPEERPFTSNCLYVGPVDITVHLGNQTKVMFGRVRTTTRARRTRPSCSRSMR